MSTESNQNTSRLMERAISGDKDSIGELLVRHRTVLTLLAAGQLYQRMQSKIDASDLVQETFLEAHRQIGAFRGTSETEFVGWLKSILVRTLAQHCRRYLGTQRRDVRLEQSLFDAQEIQDIRFPEVVFAKSQSPEEILICTETAIEIASALDSISETYKQVILLRHFQGMPLREIAKTMDRTPDSIEKLLMRGLKKLKQVLVGRLGHSFHLGKG